MDEPGTFVDTQLSCCRQPIEFDVVPIHPIDAPVLVVQVLSSSLCPQEKLVYQRE
jgi:hypothetical protein